MKFIMFLLAKIYPNFSNYVNINMMIDNMLDSLL